MVFSLGLRGLEVEDEIPEETKAVPPPPKKKKKKQNAKKRTEIPKPTEVKKRPITQFFKPKRAKVPEKNKKDEQLLITRFNKNYVGPDAIFEKAYQWVQQRDKKPELQKGDKSILILQGPSGCGKMTLIRHIAAKMDRKLRVVYDEELGKNAEMESNLHTLIGSRDAAQATSPIVAIPGVDGWDRLDKLMAFFRKLSRTAKREKATHKTRRGNNVTVSDQINWASSVHCAFPIIVTISNHYFKKRKGLYFCGDVVRMPPVQLDNMIYVAQKLKDRLKANLTKDQLYQMASMCNGDLRAMMNQVQLARCQNTVLVTGTMQAGDLDYFELMAYLLGPKKRSQQLVQEFKQMKADQKDVRGQTDYDDSLMMYQFNKAASHDMRIPGIHANAVIGDDLNRSSELLDLVSWRDSFIQDPSDYYHPVLDEYMTRKLRSTYPRVHGPYQQADFKVLCMSKEVKGTAAALSESSQSYMLHCETLLEARTRLGLMDSFDYPFLCRESPAFNEQRSRTLSTHIELE